MTIEREVPPTLEEQRHALAQRCAELEELLAEGITHAGGGGYDALKAQEFVNRAQAALNPRRKLTKIEQRLLFKRCSEAGIEVVESGGHVLICNTLTWGHLQRLAVKLHEHPIIAQSETSA